MSGIIGPRAEDMELGLECVRQARQLRGSKIFFEKEIIAPILLVVGAVTKVVFDTPYHAVAATAHLVAVLTGIKLESDSLLDRADLSPRERALLELIHHVTRAVLSLLTAPRTIYGLVVPDKVIEADMEWKLLEPKKESLLLAAVQEPILPALPSSSNIHEPQKQRLQNSPVLQIDNGSSQAVTPLETADDSIDDAETGDVPAVPAPPPPPPSSSPAVPVPPPPPTSDSSSLGVRKRTDDPATGVTGVQSFSHTTPSAHESGAQRVQAPIDLLSQIRSAGGSPSPVLTRRRPPSTPVQASDDSMEATLLRSISNRRGVVSSDEPDRSLVNDFITNVSWASDENELSNQLKNIRENGKVADLVEGFSKKVSENDFFQDLVDHLCPALKEEPEKETFIDVMLQVIEAKNREISSQGTDGLKDFIEKFKEMIGALSGEEKRVSFQRRFGSLEIQERAFDRE